MKPAPHPLRLAILAAIAASTALPALAQEAEPPPAPGPTTLDRVEVTGSRIKRTDLETSSPVAVIDR